MQRTEATLGGFNQGRLAKVGGFLPAVLLLACLLTAPTVAQAEGDAATQGPKLFTAHKCNLCHGVETMGIEAKTKSEKLVGPDLSAYESEDFDSLAKFLRKQEEADDGPHKREFAGSDEELKTLLDWLASTPAPATADDQGP